MAPDYYVTRDSGLVLWDIAPGQGDCPKAGQQVSLYFLFNFGLLNFLKVVVDWYNLLNC